MPGRLSTGPTASALKMNLGSTTLASSYQIATRTSSKVWGCSMCTLFLLSRYNCHRSWAKAYASLTRTLAAEGQFAILKTGALWSNASFVVGGKQPVNLCIGPPLEAMSHWILCCIRLLQGKLLLKAITNLSHLPQPVFRQATSSTPCMHWRCCFPRNSKPHISVHK